MKEYNLNWLKEQYDRGEKLKFLYFWGHTQSYNQEVGNFCFSQWFESPFTVDGVLYKTTEHWMMAQKSLLFNDLDVFSKIIDCDKPGEAKELGRVVKDFNEDTWSIYRKEIVRAGNIYKFNQNKQFGEYLLQTKNRVLVEASPVDSIWGIGLSKDSSKLDNVHNWRGLNLLGFALMETRDYINTNGFKSNLNLKRSWI